MPSPKMNESLALFAFLFNFINPTRYRECVNHYAKYKYAGIIETEASLKAVVILVKHR